MAKFIVLYCSKMSSKEVMANSTPDQVKASMEEWIKWAEQARKSVKFEFGMPLQAVNKITSSGTQDSDSKVSGYSFMEGNKDAVLEQLKSHPQLSRPDSWIELLEEMPMSGMDS